MSFINTFAAQPRLVIARELIAVALIVIVATLATFVFAGSVTDAPFAPPLGQLALPF